MDTRVAQIGIVVQEGGNVEELNAVLHAYAPYVIGRMGIPYREKKVNCISIVLDAPNDAISALSGKLGMLNGVTAKAIYAKMPNA